MRKTKKIKIFFSILGILVVFVLIFNQAIIKLRTNIDKLFLPIQTKVYVASLKISEIKNTIFLYKDIIKENDALKKENGELKYLNETYKEILEENKRLVDLLGIKENEKIKKDLKFARVIFQNINNINKKFYINLGSKDNIEKDMVVTYKAYLVGRVTEVFENYSLVTMLTDSRTKISVKTENGVLGLTQGNENDDGTMYSTPSTFEENLQEGQEIFTSGISDIYPEGIKIGRILKIDKMGNNIFKSIIVEPNFKSEELREVMIYKKDNIFEKNNRVKK